MTGRPPRAGLALSILTVLFAARVAGQALVAFAGVTWLPPMEAWFSGLLPYPVLLPIQIAILVGQVAVDAAVLRGGGRARPRPRIARALCWLGRGYAAAMAIRYGLTRTHAIPVVFHWVLAAYLLLLARWWAADGGPDTGAATS